MTKFSEHSSAQGEFLRGDSVAEGETLELTIKDYEVRDLKDPSSGDTEEKIVLTFDEDPRGLVINKTRGASLAKLFGDEMDDWTGRTIALYVTETPLGPGLRIKAAKATKQGTRGRHAQAESDEGDEAEEAVPRPKGRHAVTDEFRKRFADPEYRKGREPRIRRAVANRRD
jgi:hypothetical protein